MADAGAIADAGALADAPGDTGSVHEGADGQPQPAGGADEQQVSEQPAKKRGRRAGSVPPWVRAGLLRGGMHVAQMHVSPVQVAGSASAEQPPALLAQSEAETPGEQPPPRVPFLRPLRKALAQPPPGARPPPGAASSSSGVWAPPAEQDDVQTEGWIQLPEDEVAEFTAEEGEG